MMKLWWNLWWNLWCNCCETVSKCLACMKGCWYPEFEPSVEEIAIVDYQWYNCDNFLFVFFGELALGGFPIQSSTWQVEVTSRSTGSSRVPQSGFHLTINIWGGSAINEWAYLARQFLGMYLFGAILYERAPPNAQETGSGVAISGTIIIRFFLKDNVYSPWLYLYIYLCVILHGNDSMRMFRHHVVDLQWQVKVVINADRRSNPPNRGSAVWWFELMGLRRIQICVMERAIGNFRTYSSRVVAMAVAIIHGWHCFSCTVAFSSFNTVLKNVKNDDQIKLRVWLLQFRHLVVLYSLPS